MTAFNLLKNASLGCKQSCSILRYTANVIQENENKKRWITFRYEFPMPMRTILYEEYVIMDLMNVVGVIGGTFGMFIGLDFSGIIDILRDYFRRRMPWCRYALPEIWSQYALQDISLCLSPKFRSTCYNCKTWILNPIVQYFIIWLESWNIILMMIKVMTQFCIDTNNFNMNFRTRSNRRWVFYSSKKVFGRVF